MAKKVLGIDDLDKTHSFNVDIDIDTEGKGTFNMPVNINKGGGYEHRTVINASVSTQGDARVNYVSYGALDMGSIEEGELIQTKYNYVSCYTNDDFTAISFADGGFADGQSIFIQHWRYTETHSNPTVIITDTHTNPYAVVNLEVGQYARYFRYWGGWNLLYTNGTRE